MINKKIFGKLSSYIDIIKYVCEDFCVYIYRFMS